MTHLLFIGILMAGAALGAARNVLNAGQMRWMPMSAPGKSSSSAWFCQRDRRQKFTRGWLRWGCTADPSISRTISCGNVAYCAGTGGSILTHRVAPRASPRWGSRNITSYGMSGVSAAGPAWLFRRGRRDIRAYRLHIDEGSTVAGAFAIRRLIGREGPPIPLQKKSAASPGFCVRPIVAAHQISLRVARK